MQCISKLHRNKWILENFIKSLNVYLESLYPFKLIKLTLDVYFTQEDYEIFIQKQTVKSNNVNKRTDNMIIL